MTTRKFQPTEIKFTLRCEPEHMPVRGNAMASGDEDVDRETEDKIIADLEGGNQWAWCSVTVSASWAGFTGTDHLGGCSYPSAESFQQRGDYYEDMIAEALRDLLNQISEAGWDLDMGPGNVLDVAKEHGFSTMEIE